MNAKAATCPSDEMLADYGLGKLGSPGAETIHRHLETCVDCRSVVSGLSGDSFVNRLREAEAQPPVADAPAQRVRTFAAGESIPNAADGSATPHPAANQPAAVTPRPASGSSGLTNVPPELANHPDYEFLKELGRGGMGIVYLARNRMMDRLEVLKVVSKSLLDRPGALERFQQEIRSAAKLAHPNIVAAYTVLRPGDLLVFAMEYVDGQDLSQVVKQRGALPVINATSYVQQVVRGLQHAHDKGMVHRDIKPNNLMLAIAGKKHVVKILDFGLAKATSEKAVDGGLTKSGQMMGTPDYIAPEQSLDAQKADIRADIYSLGCTLYYLLAGQRPFHGNNLYEILYAHHHLEARPLSLLRPEVPVELAAIVSKMMAKDPARRYQTPEEVAQALASFLKLRATTAHRGTLELSQAVGNSIVPAARIPLVVAAQIAPLAPLRAVAPSSPADIASPTTPPFAPLVDTDLRAPQLRKTTGRPRRRYVGPYVLGLLMLLLTGGLSAAVVLFRSASSDPGLAVDATQSEINWSQEDEAKAQSDRRRAALLQASRHVPSETSPPSSVAARRSDWPPVEPGQTYQAGWNEGERGVAEQVGSPIDLGAVRTGLRAVADQANPTGSPAPSPAGSGGKPKTDGFRPLFNGRDLTGWNELPRSSTAWKVENGILRGPVGESGCLISDREDYENFHLLVEARINHDGNSGVGFRLANPGGRPTEELGYEAQIGVYPPTGSLLGFGPACLVRQPKVRSGSWFTLQIITNGSLIMIEVNGEKNVEFIDSEHTFQRGHLALLSQGTKTAVEFRKVEIRELPPSPSTP